MVKSAKSQLDEEEEPGDYDSSSYKGEEVKIDGEGSERKANAHRSKHSETEQRRRSKINERFQVLRDLIPQNDQKRDKASFLLEVIEYIQFLQEKLQMYEGSYESWSQEPAKLIPWKNHRAPAESLIDHSQAMKNGSAHENTAMLANVQNSMESDLGTASMYKALDHPPGLTTLVVPFNAQTQSNALAAVGRGSTSTQSLQDCVSDAENMSYQLQSQLWQVPSCAVECTAPNNTLNGQEELMSEPGSASVSSAYSQGVLNTLTQALQSSGLDLSQTNISVQINVGKRVNNGATAVASSSKYQEIQYLNNQVMDQTGVEGSVEDSHQPHKRMRTEKG